MASKLADAKKNLEDETLKRIDLQNQLQTMQEEHKFENSILEQQLNETRTRKQIEIEEVDSRVSSEYEQKLQSSLQVIFTLDYFSNISLSCDKEPVLTMTIFPQELRDAYEQQMAENKAGFSAVYDKKIQDLQSKLAGERGSAAGAIQEMKEMRTRWIRAVFFSFILTSIRCEGMSSRVRELEVNNHALTARLKELQEQLDAQALQNRC